jgi:hypothetical protein
MPPSLHNQQAAVSEVQFDLSAYRGHVQITIYRSIRWLYTVSMLHQIHCPMEIRIKNYDTVCMEEIFIAVLVRFDVKGH